MKSSNLAQRLEEFEATVEALNERSPRIAMVAEQEKPPRAPRRLSFDTRRIQIRDTGLPQFRVF